MKNIRYIIREVLEGEVNKAYIIIGPPSVGKSTWVKNNVKNAIVISRDDIAMRVSKAHGLRYDDLFLKPPMDSEIGDFVNGFEKFGKVVEHNEFLHFEKLLNINMDIDLELDRNFLRSSKLNKSVVVDRTNISSKDRMNVLSKLNKDLVKVAVVFNFNNKEAIDVIKRMAVKRYLEIGDKKIGDAVMDYFINYYEGVSPDEGFDEIVHVDTIPDLKLALNDVI